MTQLSHSHINDILKLFFLRCFQRICIQVAMIYYEAKTTQKLPNWHDPGLSPAHASTYPEILDWQITGTLTVASPWVRSHEVFGIYLFNLSTFSKSFLSSEEWKTHNKQGLSVFFFFSFR